MKTQIVFRIEGEDKRGPYANEELMKGILSHDVDEKHPMIHQELPHVDAWDKAKRYCFTSLKQLYTWFTKKELLGLYEAGYVLSTYNVKSEGVTASPTQAQFHIESVLA